jgi:hypothetical protein
LSLHRVEIDDPSVLASEENLPQTQEEAIEIECKKLQAQATLDKWTPEAEKRWTGAPLFNPLLIIFVLFVWKMSQLGTAYLKARAAIGGGRESASSVQLMLDQLGFQKLGNTASNGAFRVAFALGLFKRWKALFGDSRAAYVQTDYASEAKPVAIVRNQYLASLLGASMVRPRSGPDPLRALNSATLGLNERTEPPCRCTDRTTGAPPQT